MPEMMTRQSSEETPMAEITLPDVKLPDIKLPEGLRDMTRDDIVQAAKDVRLPKKIELPDVDLSKAPLPKQLADRLPGRRRTNPLWPIAGFLAIGAAIAAAWYLVTSPVTGPRVRHAFYDLRARVTGQRNDVVRYDEDGDLGSLLTDRGDTAGTPTRSSYENASTTPDVATGTAVGPGQRSAAAEKQVPTTS